MDNKFRDVSLVVLIILLLSVGAFFVVKSQQTAFGESSINLGEGAVSANLVFSFVANGDVYNRLFVQAYNFDTGSFDCLGAVCNDFGDRIPPPTSSYCGFTIASGIPVSVVQGYEGLTFGSGGNDVSCNSVPKLRYEGLTEPYISSDGDVRGRVITYVSGSPYDANVGSVVVVAENVVIDEPVVVCTEGSERVVGLCTEECVDNSWVEVDCDDNVPPDDSGFVFGLTFWLWVGGVSLFLMFVGAVVFLFRPKKRGRGRK